ncbi:Uma2 family endonuclease [soil metagenome]
MMTNKAVTERWSYAEFARLPDDGNRYEVISGDLHMTPAPRPLHQVAVTELAAQMSGFARAHDLGWVLSGPIDILFAEGDYLEPDLIFIRRERAGIISDRGIEAAPDLVVEVLSGSTAERDRGIKRERYTYFGVPTYWIVDPEARKIEIYGLAEGKAEPEIVRDTLVWRPVPGGPELEIRVAEVLRGFE